MYNSCERVFKWNKKYSRRRKCRSKKETTHNFMIFWFSLLCVGRYAIGRLKYGPYRLKSLSHIFRYLDHCKQVNLILRFVFCWHSQWSHEYFKFRTENTFLQWISIYFSMKLIFCCCVSRMFQYKWVFFFAMCSIEAQPASLCMKHLHICLYIFCNLDACTCVTHFVVYILSTELSFDRHSAAIFVTDLWTVLFTIGIQFNFFFSQFWHSIRLIEFIFYMASMEKWK